MHVETHSCSKAASSIGQANAQQPLHLCLMSSQSQASRQGKGKLLQDFLTPALHGAVCAFAPLQVVALKTEVCWLVRLCLCHKQAWAGSKLLWLLVQTLLLSEYCLAAKTGYHTCDVKFLCTCPALAVRCVHFPRRWTRAQKGADRLVALCRTATHGDVCKHRLTMTRFWAGVHVLNGTPKRYCTAAVKSLLTARVLLQHKPESECCAWCKWRWGQPVSAEEHAHLLLWSWPLPLKRLVPLAARLWKKQVCEARKLVSPNSQVRGCPAGKIHRKRYPDRVKPSGKTGQLSCLVSTFLSKAASRKQWLFTQGVAKACCLDKLASDRGWAWSVSKPLILVQPLAEAHLAHCTACAEKIARVWPLIPNDFDCDCWLRQPFASILYCAWLEFESG